MSTWAAPSHRYERRRERPIRVGLAALPTPISSVDGGIHRECLDAHLGETLPGAVNVVRVGTVAESPVGGALAAVKVECCGRGSNVERCSATSSAADEL